MPKYNEKAHKEVAKWTDDSAAEANLDQ